MDTYKIVGLKSTTKGGFASEKKDLIVSLWERRLMFEFNFPDAQTKIWKT